MSDDTPKLSDEELAELDEFLLSEACDDEVLTVDEVHGMLTALQVGPQPLDEAEWLPMAWGEPQFADEEQRQHMLGLMRRLKGDIVASLQA